VSEETKIFEIVAKNLDPTRIGLMLKEKGDDPGLWFTVTGKAADFVKFLKKGDFVEVKFDGDKVVYVRKTESSTPATATNAPTATEFINGESYEHPAFLGMCMNQAFELALALMKEQKVTVEGFWLSYEGLFKKAVEVNRKLRKEIETEQKV